MCLQIFEITAKEASLYSSEIIVDKVNKYYKLMCDGEIVICLSMYKNYFHRRNTYIQPFFLKKEINAKPIFSFLKHYFTSPLQCMLKNSDPRAQILQNGGFHLVRRCFEREFTQAELKNAITENKNIEVYNRSYKEYIAVCKLLYETYVRNHENINPLAVGFEEFTADLPQTVYCAKDGPDKGFAFTEENEICYVGGNGNLKKFFEGVLNAIFSEYQSVVFEADDIDIAAMELKNLFNDACVDSFDTYIFI